MSNTKERIKQNVLRLMEVAEDMKRKRRRAHARTSSEELEVISSPPQERPQQEQCSEDMKRKGQAE